MFLTRHGEHGFAKYLSSRFRDLETYPRIVQVVRPCASFADARSKSKEEFYAMIFKTESILFSSSSSSFSFVEKKWHNFIFFLSHFNERNNDHENR